MSQKIKLSGKVVTRFTTKPEVKIYERPTDEFELKVRLLALKHRYANIGDTYEETAALMKTEFGFDINPRDLWLLDEMSVQQETEDRKKVWEMQTSK